jgi:hypothetical protein
MILNKNVLNYKVVNFSRSKTFILVASSSKIFKYHYTPTYDYETYGFSWC